MSIVLFPASLRQESHQLRLARHLSAVIAPHCRTDIVLPGDVALPLYNPDIEAEPQWRSRVEALHERFAAADGVVVLTPEHNGQVSAYLKNTVDWLSRLPRLDDRFAGAGAFKDMPILLAGATTGWSGTLLALRDARALFAYVGGFVCAEQICVSDADQWQYGDSYVFEDAFAGHIAGVAERFVQMCARHSGTDLARTVLPAPKVA